MARHTTQHSTTTPARLSDEVLRSFGTLPEAWCQLIHNEGNAGSMTVVAGLNTLPLVMRPASNMLEFFRRGLILGRDLPERSVTTVVSEAALHRLGITGLLLTAGIVDGSPAIDLRVTPTTVQFPFSFTVFNEPPAGEPKAVFTQSAAELQRFTGDTADRYRTMVEQMLPRALPHQESLALLSDLAISRMLQLNQ